MFLYALTQDTLEVLCFTTGLAYNFTLSIYLSTSFPCIRTFVATVVAVVRVLLAGCGQPLCRRSGFGLVECSRISDVPLS
jgi:hypothetical protein